MKRNKISFVVGFILLLVAFPHVSWSWKFLLGALSIDAVLIASYFWIRADRIRSDKTIRDLSDSGKSLNELVAKDLLSKRADSKVAFGFICVAAAAQAIYFLENLYWAYLFTFGGMLLVLYAIGNSVARSKEKDYFKKFFV